MKLDHLGSTLEMKDMDEKSGSFVGYASVFDKLDNGGDIVVKGAFKGSLSKRKSANVRMLFQHDPNEVIGKWADLKEDDYGLLAQGQLNLKVQRGAEMFALLEQKAIDGLSIGYRTIKAMPDKEKNARKLVELDLWEISVVTFPMNTDSRVGSVKGEWSLRDAEHALREAGMDGNFAKLVAKYGYDEALKRVADDPRDEGTGMSDVLSKLHQAAQLMRK